MCYDKFSETCDEVLETAWSTMWNVTDETPINCERFLDGGGMHLFLRCKEGSECAHCALHMGNRIEFDFLGRIF